MSFASSSRDLSASRWAGVADSSIVDTSQSVHSRRTAILPRVGSRRISVSIRPTRRVLRMGKRCPFRGWKGCRTSAHPKDSLDAWVVRSNRRNTERPKDARLTGFRDQNPTHRTRVKRPAPKFLADCDEIFFRSFQLDSSHREPVYSRSSRAAISRHTTEGDPKISWVGYKTPQFLEPI